MAAAANDQQRGALLQRFPMNGFRDRAHAHQDVRLFEHRLIGRHLQAFVCNTSLRFGVGLGCDVHHSQHGAEDRGKTRGVQENSGRRRAQVNSTQHKGNHDQRLPKQHSVECSF